MNKEMKIIYKKEFKIKLFGEKFIKNNKNNCIILIKYKKNGNIHVQKKMIKIII